jgi:hypothetical protein
MIAPSLLPVLVVGFITAKLPTPRSNQSRGVSRGSSLARVSQVERGAATLEHLLTSALAFVASSHSSATETAGRVERPDVVGVLSQLASGARLLRSADSRYCAQVPIGDRLEIYGLTSAGNSDTRKLVCWSANARTRGWQPREHAAGKAAGEKSLVKSSVPSLSICTVRRNTQLTKLQGGWHLEANALQVYCAG